MAGFKAAMEYRGKEKLKRIKNIDFKPLHQNHEILPLWKVRCETWEGKFSLGLRVFSILVPISYGGFMQENIFDQIYFNWNCTNNEKMQRSIQRWKNYFMGGILYNIPMQCMLTLCIIKSTRYVFTCFIWQISLSTGISHGILKLAGMFKERSMKVHIVNSLSIINYKQMMIIM